MTPQQHIPVSCNRRKDDSLTNLVLLAYCLLFLYISIDFHFASKDYCDTLRKSSEEMKLFTDELRILTSDLEEVAAEEK